MQQYLSKCSNKCQSFILILKMPKTKWGGAKEPTINNFYKINNRKFANILMTSLHYDVTTCNQNINKQSVSFCLKSSYVWENDIRIAITTPYSTSSFSELKLGPSNARLTVANNWGVVIAWMYWLFITWLLNCSYVNWNIIIIGQIIVPFQVYAE